KGKAEDKVNLFFGLCTSQSLLDSNGLWEVHISQRLKGSEPFKTESS
ncbi:MAG: hypothetical protein ACI85E_002132, partial [Marinomonas primoryensis]